MRNVYVVSKLQKKNKQKQVKNIRFSATKASSNLPKRGVNGNCTGLAGRNTSFAY